MNGNGMRWPVLPCGCVDDDSWPCPHERAAEIAEREPDVVRTRLPDGTVLAYTWDQSSGSEVEFVEVEWTS